MRKALIVLGIACFALLVGGGGMKTGSWTWLYRKAERTFTDPPPVFRRINGGGSSTNRDGAGWSWTWRKTSEVRVHLVVRQTAPEAPGPRPARVDVIAGGERIRGEIAIGDAVEIECDISTFLYGWGEKNLRFEVFDDRGERIFWTSKGYDRPFLPR